MRPVVGIRALIVLATRPVTAFGFCIGHLCVSISVSLCRCVRVFEKLTDVGFAATSLRVTTINSLTEYLVAIKKKTPPTTVKDAAGEAFVIKQEQF